VNNDILVFNNRTICKVFEHNRKEIVKNKIKTGHKDISWSFLERRFRLTLKESIYLLDELFCAQGNAIKSSLFSLEMYNALVVLMRH